MIVFSHDIFLAQKAGGISRCMVDLMRSLDPETCPWTLWAGTHSSRPLNEAIASQPALAASIVARYKPDQTGRPWAFLSSEIRFSSFARAHHASIIHRTYYPIADMPSPRVARVETLHDLWDERAAATGSPRAKLKSRLKRRALEKADRIICVSRSTLSELEAVWPWAASKSCVIPHGVRRLSTKVLPALKPERPFFLYVGRRESYKNFEILVAAFRDPALADFDLKCFGGGEFSSHERAVIGAAGLRRRVTQEDGGDDRLALMYESAIALLYPSKYEGFGLPLLEAMIHGCPVVTTPLTSLPEVAGNAALYASPDSPDDWSAQMNIFAYDQAVADSFRVKGFARAAQFSWQSTASAHEALYRSLEVNQ